MVPTTESQERYLTAWRAGNFAEAYEGMRTASQAWAGRRHLINFQPDPGNATTEARQLRATIVAGFIVGFYASYELHEIHEEDRPLHIYALAWATQSGVDEAPANAKSILAGVGDLVWVVLEEFHAS